MKKLLIVSLLSLALSLLLVSAVLAEDYCVEQVGADYSCDEGSAYPGSLSEFEDYCANVIGGNYLPNLLTPPDQCITGCCCGIDKKGTFSTEEVVSKAYCSLDDHNFFSGATVCIGDEGVCVNDNWIPQGAKTYNIEGKVFNETGGSVDSVTIHYPSRNSDVITASNDQGKFFLSNIAEGDIAIYFEHPNCLSYTEPLTLENNITDLEITLDCSRSSCIPEAVDSLVVDVESGSKNVHLSWDKPQDYCPQLSSYIIEKCDSDGEDANSQDATCKQIGVTNPEELSFTDENKDFGKRACYQIEEVYYGEDSQQSIVPMIIPKSDSNCVGPFNEYCIQNQIDDNTNFCLSGEISYLDDGASSTGDLSGVFQCSENTLNLVDDCSNNQVCYSGSCVNPNKCSLCNGLYGSFVNSLAKVWGTRTCENLNDCYLDNNGLSYDTYQHCGYVQSCYDYNSKNACEDDACNLGEGCTWLPASEGEDINELGEGACIPTQPKVDGADIVYECDRCDDFAVCTPDSCSWLGNNENCLYVPEDLRDDSSCVSKQDAICEYYSHEDCGGDALQVDVSYQDGLRTGGTNQITNPSNDKLGLGVCKWLSDEDRCVKDADGNNFQDCSENGLENNYACLHDYQVPETNLPFANLSYLTETELSNSEPIVIDNDDYAPTDTKTYACIEEISSTAEKATCYPSNSTEYLWPNNFDFTEDGLGLYSINYYSEDPAGNLEPLKEIKVYIYALSDAKLISAGLSQQN